MQLRLKPHIKKQPNYWKYIPWLKRCQGLTVVTNIYLQPDIYSDLQSQNPKPENIAVLVHEETHVKRIKEQGAILFGLKYLFNGQYRFNEELIATKASFTVLKKYKIKVNLLKKAWVLSNWLYLWPVNYSYALKEIKKAWKES